MTKDKPSAERINHLQKQSKRDRFNSRRRVLQSMALRQAERHIQEFYDVMRAQSHPVEPKIASETRIKWHHVYHLVDPRNGTVFYVGKGRRRRILQHERQAELGMLTAKCEKIREIWKAGFQVEFRTVALFTNSLRAHEYECALIKQSGDSITNVASTIRSRAGQ